MKYFEDIQLNDVKESHSLTIQTHDIIEFAKQWDPQPFHIDEQAAKDWPMGLIASSVHTYAISVKLCLQISNEPVAAIAGLGIDAMRMTAPVKPGDQLRVRLWIDAKRESRSNPDRGIATTRIEVLNQDDVVVMSYSNSGLIMKRPVDNRKFG